MRFLWQRDKQLDEAARIERGKLAAAVVKNDRVRNRLQTYVKETPIGDMLTAMMAQLDEGHK